MKEGKEEGRREEELDYKAESLINKFQDLGSEHSNKRLLKVLKHESDREVEWNSTKALSAKWKQSGRK
jgi:hypothetical protein